MKHNKNIYLAALAHAITTNVGLENICFALGCEYVSESHAYCWLEEDRTEREIITLLRAIGYEIPKYIKGSTQIKFDTTVQEE